MPERVEGECPVRSKLIPIADSRKGQTMEGTTYQNLGEGNSLEGQWLALGTFTAVAQVQSLVGELRSCKPHGTAKNQTNKQKTTKIWLWRGPKAESSRSSLEEADSQIPCPSSCSLSIAYLNIAQELCSWKF